jgi:hypothetical protein
VAGQQVEVVDREVVDREVDLVKVLEAVEDSEAAGSAVAAEDSVVAVAEAVGCGAARG